MWNLKGGAFALAHFIQHPVLVAQKKMVVASVDYLVFQALKVQNKGRVHLGWLILQVVEIMEADHQVLVEKIRGLKVLVVIL